jgi:hypothetical protein
VGFLAGALLVSVPANISALARETAVSPWHFATALTPWGVRLAMLIPVAVAANLFVRSGSLIVVGAAAVAMSAGYAAVMLPMALRPPLGEYVRRALSPVFEWFGWRRRAPQSPVASHEPGSLA